MNKDEFKRQMREECNALSCNLTIEDVIDKTLEWAALGQEPLFWYRPLREGMYEGPVHHRSVGGKMMRDEKPSEWKPLHEHAAPRVESTHPDDAAVDNFAMAMKEKLALSRSKGRSGWEQMPPVELSAMLHEHVEKGDPLDVANFCMFLWNFSALVCPRVVPDKLSDDELWEVVGLESMPDGFKLIQQHIRKQFGVSDE